MKDKKVRCGRGIMKYCCQSNECSHWIELPMVEQGKETPKIVGHCVDWFQVQLQWDNNRIQIGQQSAIESFRNEMARPNPAMVALVNILSGAMNKKRIIFEHETQKLLEKEEKGIKCQSLHQE